MSIEKLRPSFTFTEDRLKELQAVVPEAFADGKIAWDTLREALGEQLEDESQEHFGLFWPGKREARRLAAMPSKGTLVPQPGQGVDEDTTHNLFIEGDNLEVLKLLQKSYAGRVKMIYIDPPYNTGNDFVYADDYSEPLEVYLKRTEQMDEAGQLLTSNSRASGRFHSNWLNMMYPRLYLARQLLREDGVIFVSIDENEISNLRQVMNEVYGEENFIVQLVWLNQEGGGGSDSSMFRIKHEYILVYAKTIENVLIKGVGISNLDRYQSQDNYVKTRGPYYLQKLNQASIQYSTSLDYEIEAPDGKKLTPWQGSKRACWRWSRKKLDWGIKNEFVVFKKDREDNWQVYTKQYLKVDNEGKVIERTNRPMGVIQVFSTTQASKTLYEVFGEQVFNYSKPYELIKYLLELSTDGDDIVLDFFAGSGTTAHAVMVQNREDQGNRRFILVQLPEPTEDKYKTIAEICKERIRRVSSKMKADKKGQLDLSGDEDLGSRSFKLDQSHFTKWQPYTERDTTQLELRFQQAEAPLVENWKPENLLTEILLLQGFPLDSRVRPLPEFKKNDVKEVSSEFCQHRLYVCLDGKAQPETVAAIKLRPEDILVCLDSALTDEDKITLADRCNLKVV
jgi:adenine-specific DNA-methyltransferase